MPSPPTPEIPVVTRFSFSLPVFLVGGEKVRVTVRRRLPPPTCRAPWPRPAEAGSAPVPKCRPGSPPHSWARLLCQRHRAFRPALDGRVKGFPCFALKNKATVNGWPRTYHFGRCPRGKFLEMELLGPIQLLRQSRWLRNDEIDLSQSWRLRNPRPRLGISWVLLQ